MTHTPVPSGIDTVLWERVGQMKNEMAALRRIVGRHDKDLTEITGHKDTGILGKIDSQIIVLRDSMTELQKELKQVRAMNFKTMLFALSGAGIGSAGVQALLQALGSG